MHYAQELRGDRWNGVLYHSEPQAKKTSGKVRLQTTSGIGPQIRGIKKVPDALTAMSAKPSIGTVEEILGIKNSGERA